jgi:hypothetical protein
MIVCTLAQFLEAVTMLASNRAGDAPLLRYTTAKCRLTVPPVLQTAVRVAHAVVLRLRRSFNQPRAHDGVVTTH